MVGCSPCAALLGASSWLMMPLTDGIYHKTFTMAEEKSETRVALGVHRAETIGVALMAVVLRLM